MTKYSFHVELTVFGDYETEIGNQDPEEFIENELEAVGGGISVNDLTNITGDETEVIDFQSINREEEKDAKT